MALLGTVGRSSLLCVALVTREEEEEEAAAAAAASGRRFCSVERWERHSCKDREKFLCG